MAPPGRPFDPRVQKRVRGTCPKPGQGKPSRLSATGATVNYISSDTPRLPPPPRPLPPPLPRRPRGGRRRPPPPPRRAPPGPAPGPVQPRPGRPCGRRGHRPVGLRQLLPGGARGVLLRPGRPGPVEPLARPLEEVAEDRL